MRYPDFPGLNLSWEVREGIARHSTTYDTAEGYPELKEFMRSKQPSLETQIVDMADEIAYDNHDLDDGLTSGLIAENDLEKIPLWQMRKKLMQKRHPAAPQEIGKYLIIRSLINFQVTDLIDHTAQNLKACKIDSLAKARDRTSRLVGFSPKVTALRKPLRRFLHDNLYYSRRVMRMTEKAKRFIKELFDNYCANEWQIPAEFRQRRNKKDTLKRMISDYIAGMTDRSVLDEHKKLFDPHERV